MANSLSFEKANPSKLKRLSFLPRIGFTVEFGGRQFVYRHAPIAEALVNMVGKKFSLNSLLEISYQQLREITLPDTTPKVTKRNSKR